MSRFYRLLPDAPVLGIDRKPSGQTLSFEVYVNAILQGAAATPGVRLADLFAFGRRFDKSLAAKAAVVEATDAEHASIADAASCGRGLLPIYAMGSETFMIEITEAPTSEELALKRGE